MTKLDIDGARIGVLLANGVVQVKDDQAANTSWFAQTDRTTAFGIAGPRIAAGGPRHADRRQAHRHAGVPQADVRLTARGTGQPADRVHQSDARHERSGTEVCARPGEQHPSVRNAAGLVELLGIRIRSPDSST